MNSKVSIVRCSKYEPALVLGAVKRAIDLLGGIANFVKPESKVLVKPNLLMAKEPEAGITTHPQVVAALIKILKELNCRVFVGDGPSVWGNQIENVDEVYRLSGIERVCQEEGAVLVKFDKRRWREKFPLTTWLDECDFLINVPKLKTHDFTVLTAAVKNLFGLVPGTYKTELHKNYFAPGDFAGILVDIYRQARPHLNIIDAITAMEGDGPATSGRLRSPHLLLASGDGVAIDSVAASIMGLDPLDVLTTKEAAERGLGEARLDAISIVGEKLDAITAEPFLLPSTSIGKKLPPPLVKLARKLIKYYPAVKRGNCIACAACVQACPNQAAAMKGGRVVFDYAKCIACFCCQEACPAAAIKVKKSILAKMVGL